ncbi:hypothetical protein LXL04_026596 [Taraxacum kok-saghyz]
MTWHYEHQTESGLMVHPIDGEAWKHFDSKHPEFASEPRNVRLGLCTDGFCPTGSNSKPYSCWPVFLSVYNLPAWMCLKEPYVQLSMIIPGKKSPSQNLDVFLRPLIDELKMLFADGVVTYDASRKCNFTMKAMLLWTVERFGPPPTLTGDQIWEQVRHFPTVYEGKPYRPKNEKFHGFGSTHNWVKRSIFWELPYWRTLLIRHNLDVMHIEKNVFDNLFNTVMDTSKSKNNIKARKDIEKYCNRAEWHTWKQGNKDVKKRASFALDKEQVIKIGQWLTKLKFPDGYASNLGGCVNVEDSSFYSFKSHECHVFMQRLLPIALRGMIPRTTWDAITELCTFFRAICSKVLHVDDLLRLQITIVETICRLEKVFPPGFFDSMEHLVVHLAREAMLGCPVQHRWMYLYERKLGSMKRKIKNHAKVEGSIVEAYIVGEISTFCSLYFLPTIETRLNREPRNFAHDIPSYTTVDSRLSIFKVPSRRLFEKSGRRMPLSDDEMRIAHNYILINCVEVLPFMRLFEDYASQRQPAMDDEAFGRFRDQHFARWFEQHVFEESNDITQHLKDLARGPLRHVRSYEGYFVNGYKFHTEKYGDGRVTHNSGVCVRGTCYNEAESDYFGLLNEVLEVEYQGMGRCIVVLFKCTWFDPIEGVKVLTKHNLVDIKYKSRLRNDDPFILASQVEQVYYVPYPSMKDLNDWWAVIKTKPRGVYELRQCVSEEDDDEEDQFFQEIETLIPYASSSANEAEEPTCLVIEGEIQEFDEDEYGEDGEDEEEYDDNLDDSDEDGDDEVELCVARGGGGGGGHGRGRGHGRGDNGGGGDTKSQNTGESHPSFVSVRGSNILDQVPSDPKKRKFIEVESDDEFSDHPAVIRDITCILKTMFRGTWDSWKSIDKDDREAMWRLFKDIYGVVAFLLNGLNWDKT